MDDFGTHTVHPEEIAIVILTHFHRDYVGWNILAANDNTSQPFPMRYWMNTKDCEAYRQPEIHPSAFPTHLVASDH